MKIWIFQTGEPLHIDESLFRPMRAMNLADLLVENGHEVTVWSSAFFHQLKEHRTRKYSVISVQKRLEIRLIPSPGYSGNISLSRIWDHIMLARNLAQVLKKEKNLPDVAFLGYPPIESFFVMARWLTKRRVPFIADVKDQWPSIFVTRSPAALRPLVNLALLPYFHYAKNSLGMATSISSISQSFVQWSQNLAGKPKRETDLVIPLTVKKELLCEADIKDAKKFFANNGICFEDDVPKFCFAGTFSLAFDFSHIIDVAKRFEKEGLKAQFIFCGDGPQMQKLRKNVVNLKNFEILGWVSKKNLSALFSESIASLAPYKSSVDFRMSIPNKFIDALAYGKPILTSLDGEVKEIIEQNSCGFYYEDSETLYNICKSFCTDKRFLMEIAANAAKTYEKEFNFYRVYGALVNQLEKLGAKKLGANCG